MIVIVIVIGVAVQRTDVVSLALRMRGCLLDDSDQFALAHHRQRQKRLVEEASEREMGIAHHLLPASFGKDLVEVVAIVVVEELSAPEQPESAQGRIRMFRVTAL